jgi:hypothetical protein
MLGHWKLFIFFHIIEVKPSIEYIFYGPKVIQTIGMRSLTSFNQTLMPNTLGKG